MSQIWKARLLFLGWIIVMALAYEFCDKGPFQLLIVVCGTLEANLNFQAIKNYNKTLEIK